MPFRAEPPVWKRAQALLPAGAPFITDSRRGWRMRAKLAVRGSKTAPLIGLFRKGSHDVLSIPDCHAHHPSINRAADELLRAMIRLGVEPYEEARHRGELRYAQCFVERRTNRVQLTLVVREHCRARALARALWETSGLWHSIWINAQPERTNRVFGHEWLHCFGPPVLLQPIGRAEIAFHPGAFAQAHLNLFDRLLETIEEWVPPASRLLEIYAGAGGISSHLSPRLQEALLIEDNPHARASFLASPMPGHLRYLQADAAASLPYLASYDLILADPPRKGLDPALLNALRPLETQRLIAISCSFESFERDANALLSSGWNMTKAAGFWLFPGADQVELAVLWEKRA